MSRIKKILYETVRGTFRIETLKDNPLVKAYRDFYWKLGIDLIKTRPSGEALLRRVLHGDELPSISPVVETYSLASTRTILPVSGFNLDLLNPYSSH